MKPILIIFFLATCGLAEAQSCEYFPADCPGDMSVKDSTECINRYIVSQEITMQNMIRDNLTDQMQAIADSRNWLVYEYEEDANGIAVKPDNQNEPAYPLPYPLRAPHDYIISFIFIVNTDSLNAWKYWYNNDLPEMSNKVVANYSRNLDNSFQDNHKIFMDSADYWNNQKTGYMANNMEAYQKALIADDKSGIKKYEDANKQYDAHINYWINKISDKNKNALAGPDRSHEQFQNEVHTRTDAFRNSTMIRVKFEFNERLASASGTGDLHLVKQIPFQTAFLAQLFHNNATDERAIYDLNQLNRSTDLAFILFGKWNGKPDLYNQYHALFEMDKKNLDEVTPKKKTCEKVQTISIHVEGSPFHTEMFLKSLDPQKLENLIVKP